MSGYRGKNRPSQNGGPQGVQRSYASQLNEHEPTFNTYEHLQGLPRGDTALTMLRKVASMVKPVMRKRGWKVQILAEFLPQEQNLLGLNINRGYKICVRLRYHNNPDLFLPTEQVIDTMLHELSHIIWGEHDGNFHRLWDELRDELETLIRKGYTGEGFLSEGKRLGGGRNVPPPHEMRRLARASAEKRQAQNKLSKGSGRKLGGTPLHLYGGDVRNIIADQVTQRNTINKGCGSGRKDAIQLSDQSAANTFKTKAEEDDANNRAIAQALYELMEQEEERKLNGTFSAAPINGGLAWDPAGGLYDPAKESKPESNGDHPQQPSEERQIELAMQESLRSSPNTPVQQNLFQPPSHNDSDMFSQPPPIPVDSKPSPVSAASNSQPASSNSPVSPLKTGDTNRGNPSSTAFGPTSPRPTVGTSEGTNYPLIDLSDCFDPNAGSSDQWTCDICTCINPLQFLACDACGTEQPQKIGIGNRGARPKPKPKPDFHASTSTQNASLGWSCSGCGAFMEHRWWTCSACGKMKDSS